MTPSADLRVLAWPARRKRTDNPYSFLVQQSTATHGVVTSELTPQALLRRDWDIIHIHWPDMILLRGSAVQQTATAVALLGALRLQQASGAKVVWTIHNVEPHEVRSRRVASWFMDRFSKLVDGVLSPSEIGLRQATERYPWLADKPSALSRIGSYEGEYPPAPTREAARSELNIDTAATVFLAFGMIRRYKNLPHLAQTFAEFDDPDARLIIAGMPKDDDEVRILKELAAADLRVRLIAERIPDASVPRLFAAADCFVAPFSNILNSSSVMLALSYDCRVLVPRVGALPEMAADVGGDWIRLYDGSFDLSVLCSATAGPSSPKPDLSRYGWDAIGLATARFFRALSRRVEP